MHSRFCFPAGVLALLLAPQLGAVSVTGFNPPFGSTNDLITIYGSGFSGLSVTVTFYNNQVTAGYPTSDSVLYAYVPATATTGPLKVTVDGSFASSSSNFTMIGPGPYVSGFSPSGGGAGLTVYVDGTHFGSAPATGVTFNGKSGVNFFVQSETRILVDTPSGVTTGPVVVQSPLGNWTSTNFFVPPVLKAFSPWSGRPGTNVVLTGTNFTGATAVRFSSAAGPFTLAGDNLTVLSNLAVRVRVPTNATTGPIAVDAPLNSDYSSSNFVLLPTIYGFSPGSGPANTSVTITGANLNEGAPVVRFNNVTAAAPTGVSYGQLTALVPAAATSGPLSVTTTNGSHTNSAFFYVPASITSFTPNNSPPGSHVKITGVNFTNASAVNFGGVPAASFVVTNNTSIGAVVPSGVLTGPVGVTTPAGSTNSQALFYGAPGIAAFSPAHGLPGASVGLAGSNFLGATEVRFGSLTASFTVTNNVSLGAFVPVGAQTAPITVVAPAGTSTTVSNFVLDYQSDIAVVVNDAPDPVRAGSNLVYAITVVNHGPSAAQNVRLTNALPASVLLLGAAASQGSLNTNASPITGDLGSILSGSQVTVTFTGEPTRVGAITNAVTVAGDYPDPNAANNATNSVTIVEPPLLAYRWLTNQVRLSWAERLGWWLQAQSNAAGSGLGAATNWHSLANTTTTNVYLAPVSKTNGSVFFRLLSP